MGFQGAGQCAHLCLATTCLRPPITTTNSASELARACQANPGKYTGESPARHLARLPTRSRKSRSKKERRTGADPEAIATAQRLRPAGEYKLQAPAQMILRSFQSSAGGLRLGKDDIHLERFRIGSQVRFPRSRSRGCVIDSDWYASVHCLDPSADLAPTGNKRRINAP